QKYLEGPDNLLRILTQFRNRTGTVSRSGYAEVIIEDHAPGWEGNARAVLAARRDEAAEQGARGLEGRGGHGGARRDLRVDPARGGRTGRDSPRRPRVARLRDVRPQGRPGHRARLLPGDEPSPRSAPLLSHSRRRQSRGVVHRRIPR